MPAVIRPATAADFQNFFAKPPPPIWLGMLYERDGMAVAIGTVVWEEWGHAICFYHCKEAISKFTMHRVARRVIEVLRKVGEPAVFSVPDRNIPGATTWLQRLGFRPSGYTPPGYDEEVWRLDLADAASAS